MTFTSRLVCPTASRLFAVALASVLLATGVATAQLSGGSASTAGSTGNSNSSDGSNNAATQVLINTATVVQTRYAWNVNADVGVFSTRQQNANAQHNVSFSAAAPGGYRLDVSQTRVGDMNRINDASGCSGSADISGVANPTFTGGTLTSGAMTLGDPGSIGNGGSTTSIPFSQSQPATIHRVSNGATQGHSYSFTWSGAARSNSCEAAVRLGNGSGSTTGCGACGYPGSPGRTQSNDGHFMTFSFVSLCGNGMVDNVGPVVEQCDPPGGCCTSTCQFVAGGTQCRASAGICDVAETCPGNSATCPGNGFQPASVTCRPTAGVCDVAENLSGERGRLSCRRLPRSADAVSRVGGRMRHRRGVSRQQRGMPCQ